MLAMICTKTPYSKCLSKFRQGLITLTQLETVVSNAAVYAQEFALNPATMCEHLQAVRNHLSA